MKFLAFAFLVVVTTVDALGQSNFFLGTGATNSWDDPDNWSLGIVPINSWVHPNAWDDHDFYGFELSPGDTTDDGPRFNNANMLQTNGTTTLVDSSVHATSYGVRVGNGGATNTLLITGGQLDIGIDPNVGPSVNAVGHHLQVGRGYPGFEGGPVNANPLATVLMSGGIMNTNGVLIPEQFVDNSLFDPNDPLAIGNSEPLNGELIMSGGTINARWMNLGQLRGNGSAELSGDAVINLASNVPGQSSNGGHLSFNRPWNVSGMQVPGSGNVSLDIRDNAIINIYGHLSGSIPDPDASEIARYQSHIDAGELTADNGTDEPTLYLNPTEGVLKICALDADYDSDCDVDEDDLAAFVAGYGSVEALKNNGDSDNDEDVDGADFLEWQREFGVGVELLGSLTNVPEPASATILIIGGISTTLNRRPKACNITTKIATYSNSGTES